MPNFRKVRDSGVDYNKAYLGYMASETVIAHNVIPSGPAAQEHGLHRRGLPRPRQHLRQGHRPQMHITGDLSLADFATVQKNHGQPYPKLADYLHTARPGTKFITVGEKSYAVETATGCERRHRRAPLGEPEDRRHTRPPAAAATWRSPGAPPTRPGAGPPARTCRRTCRAPDSVDPTLCGRYFINSDKANDYGTAAAFPSWLYPSEGNRFWPGNDPHHLGGDTWVADAAIAMMENEHWSGMFVTLGGHRQGSPHVGSPGRHGTEALHDARGPDPREVRGRERRRPARQAPRRDQEGRPGQGRQDAGRAHRRPRCDVRPELPTARRTSGAGDSNWYYAPPDLGVWDAGSAAAAGAGQGDLLQPVAAIAAC